MKDKDMLSVIGKMDKDTNLNAIWWDKAKQSASNKSHTSSHFAITHNGLTDLCINNTILKWAEESLQLPSSPQSCKNRALIKSIWRIDLSFRWRVRSFSSRSHVCHIIIRSPLKVTMAASKFYTCLQRTHQPWRRSAGSQWVSQTQTHTHV